MKKLLGICLLLCGCATAGQSSPEPEDYYYFVIDSQAIATATVTFYCGSSVYKRVRGIELGLPATGRLRADYGSCLRRHFTVYFVGHPRDLYTSDDLNAWHRNTAIHISISNVLRYSNFLIRSRAP